MEATFAHTNPGYRLVVAAVVVLGIGIQPNGCRESSVDECA